MIRTKPAVLAAMLLVAASPSAVAQQASAQSGNMPAMTGTMPQTAGGSPADQAFMQGMATMTKSMDVPMSGNPDRDFVTMMIPHHQGAIDMARVELRYGHDSGLRRLARAIVGAQEREIAQMQRWLAKHPQ